MTVTVGQRDKQIIMKKNILKIFIILVSKANAKTKI